MTAQQKVQELVPGWEYWQANHNAYVQGIAEAFGAVALMNDSTLYTDAKPRVCLPVKNISKEMMEAAIREIIGTHRQPKEIPENMRKVPVAVLGLVGLATLFPCK